MSLIKLVECGDKMNKFGSLLVGWIVLVYSYIVYIWCVIINRENFWDLSIFFLFIFFIEMYVCKGCM